MGKGSKGMRCSLIRLALIALAQWLTLDKTLLRLEPQFPYLKNGANNMFIFQGSVRTT